MINSVLKLNSESEDLICVRDQQQTSTVPKQYYLRYVKVPRQSFAHSHIAVYLQCEIQGIATSQC